MGRHAPDATTPGVPDSHSTGHALPVPLPDRECVMNPFLVEVAHKLDSYQSRDEIMSIMDELEYLFEALGEDQQDACSHMMSLLEKRLTALD
jgi:hypothetical protein